MPGTHSISNEPLIGKKILEDERKFVSDSLAFSIFRKQNEWPGPEIVVRLSPHVGHAFPDIYHDTPDLRILGAHQRVSAQRRMGDEDAPHRRFDVDRLHRSVW